MIYSLRHPLRFVKKILAKPEPVQELAGEKYAIVCFSEELILDRSPFQNIMYSRMLEVLLPNSVFDPNRNVRWVKMAVRRGIGVGHPPYMLSGQSTMYWANFAALYNDGKHVLTYKNRDLELPHIPDEVHRLKTLHYFPQSEELEAM